MTCVLLITLFAAILAYALSFLFIVWRNHEQIRLQDRLGKLIGDQAEPTKPSAVKKEKRAGFSKIPPIFGKALGKIASELSMAGVMLKPEEFLLIWVLLGGALPLLCVLISHNAIIAAGLAIFGAALPPLILSRAKKQRMKLFETQFSEALVVIGNSLRAGFTFQQAMDGIANEMPEPISKEFGKVVREIKLSVPFDEALQNMVRRLGNDDVDLLVSAVIIQRQVGGNLSDILDNIADTIKERLRIRGEIKTLTASGRISGLIVGLMPLFLLAFLMVSNPSYVMLFFTTPLGIAMLVLAGVMELIGFVIIRKIVNIKF